DYKVTGVQTCALPISSALTIASASRIAGKAKSTSLTRITIASTQPPKKPAATPATVPIVPAIATETSATCSEAFTPSTQREKMSRPNWSVPSQYFEDGPSSRSSGCCDTGSNGSTWMSAANAPTSRTNV